MKTSSINLTHSMARHLTATNRFCGLVGNVENYKWQSLIDELCYRLRLSLAHLRGWTDGFGEWEFAVRAIAIAWGAWSCWPGDKPRQSPHRRYESGAFHSAIIPFPSSTAFRVPLRCAQMTGSAIVNSTLPTAFSPRPACQHVAPSSSSTTAKFDSATRGCMAALWQTPHKSLKSQGPQKVKFTYYSKSVPSTQRVYRVFFQTLPHPIVDLPP